MRGTAASARLATRFVLADDDEVHEPPVDAKAPCVQLARPPIRALGYERPKPCIESAGSA
jgi:hypothetical protein